MATAITYFAGAKQIIDELIFNEQSFKVSSTTQSISIDTGTEKYFFSDEPAKKIVFPMMRKIKTEVEKNAAAVVSCKYAKQPYDIKYFDFSPKITEIEQTAGEVCQYANVIEADITGAYFSAAQNLGFLSKATVQQCLKMDKLSRLRALGGMAAVKTTEYYNAGKLEYTETEKSELHREAWFKISSYVDCAIQALRFCFDNIHKDIFLFYWVDGIYFNKFNIEGIDNGLNNIIENLNKHFHFTWKIQELKKMQVSNMQNMLEVEITKPNGKKKLFYPPANKVSYYKMTDNNTGKIILDKEIIFNNLTPIPDAY